MIWQRSPNGVGFTNASDADIARIENRINNYLRDIFVTMPPSKITDMK
mgnify:CR=1 FL=1